MVRPIYVWTLRLENERNQELMDMKKLESVISTLSQHDAATNSAEITALSLQMSFGTLRLGVLSSLGSEAVIQQVAAGVTSYRAMFRSLAETASRIAMAYQEVAGAYAKASAAGGVVDEAIKEELAKERAAEQPAPEPTPETLPQ